MKPKLPEELNAIPGFPHLKWTPSCTVAETWVLSANIWAVSEVIGAGCRMTRAMRPVAHLSIPGNQSKNSYWSHDEIAAWIADEGLRSSLLTAKDLPAAFADLGCLARLASHELGEDVTLTFDISHNSMPEHATLHMPDWPVLALPQGLGTVLGNLCRNHKLRAHTWSTDGRDLPRHAPRRITVTPAAVTSDEAKAVILERLCGNDDDIVGLNRNYIAKQMDPVLPAQWRNHVPTQEKPASKPLPGIDGAIFDEGDEFSIVVLEAERLLPQAEDDRPVAFGRGRMPIIRFNNQRAPQKRGTYSPRRWLPTSDERAAAIAHALTADYARDSILGDIAETLSSLSGNPFRFSYYVVPQALRDPNCAIRKGWIKLPNFGPMSETIKQNLEILLDGFEFSPRFSYFHDGAAQTVNYDIDARSGDRSGHEIIAATVRVEKTIKKLKKRQRDAWSALKNIFDVRDTNQAA